MNAPARQLCPQCGSDDVVIGDVTSLCNRCGEVFPTGEENRRRIAAVVRLPIVPRRNWHDPDWREQYERTCAAVGVAMHEPPPRTRPLVVAYRPEAKR